MGVISGKLEMAAASDFSIVKIDPPTLNGYVHRLEEVNLIWGGDDTANNSSSIMVIGSVNAQTPSAITIPSDGLIDSTLFAWLTVFATDAYMESQLIEGQVQLRHSNNWLWANGEMYFQDFFQLAMQAPANVAASKTIDLHYRFTYEDVRATNKLNNLLLDRMYT